jgi:hypothetical protein
MNFSFQAEVKVEFQIEARLIRRGVELSIKKVNGILLGVV